MATISRRSLALRRGWRLALVIGVGLPAAANAAVNTPEELANKKLVMGLYAALGQASQKGDLREEAATIVHTFMSPAYIQHSQIHRGHGAEGLIKEWQKEPDHPPLRGSFGSRAPIALMAEGDLVMQLSGKEDAAHDSGGLVFNMFRVKGGKLVEHWDLFPQDFSSNLPPMMKAAAASKAK